MGQTMDELLEDPHCHETGMFVDQTHPQYGWTRVVGVIPKFSAMEGIIRRPAPLLGEHTEEVLTELGYSEDQITALKTERVAYGLGELL